MDLHICIDNTSILFFLARFAKILFYVGQGFGFFFSSIDIDNLVQLLRCCKSSSYWHWKKTIVETFTGLPLERQYQYANERLNLILAQSEEQSAKFFCHAALLRLQFSCPRQIGFLEKRLWSPSLAFVGLDIGELKAFHYQFVSWLSSGQTTMAYKLKIK